MIRKSALALVVVLLILSSSSWAQQGTGGFEFEPSAHRLEIIPMGGYVWTWSKSAYYGAYSGDFDLESGGFWGIAADIDVKPGVQARLLYRRQDTKIKFNSVGYYTDDLGDMAVEYWHIGGVAGMAKGNIKPFTSLTLGGTRYISDYGDDWKFSIILSLGAKIYINNRIGLMFAGQMPFTFTDAFVGIGTGGMSFGGTGIVQMDVVAGLIIGI